MPWTTCAVRVRVRVRVRARARARARVRARVRARARARARVRASSAAAPSAERRAPAILSASGEEGLTRTSFMPTWSAKTAPGAMPTRVASALRHSTTRACSASCAAAFSGLPPWLGLGLGLATS